MSNYVKPQSPIYHEGSDNYIYPLTTADQIILEDGSRLNALLELGNDSLSINGGVMKGDIAMSGNRITGLAEPSSFTDVATKGYVDGRRKLFTVTLLADNWTGIEAPYKQTINVDGITNAHTPHYGPVFSDDLGTSIAEKEAYMLVDDLETFDGSVIFTCFADKPVVDLIIQMEVFQ